jgi:hypothetical protein
MEAQRLRLSLSLAKKFMINCCRICVRLCRREH